MSTSLKVVSMAAVLCASMRRLAMVARRLDMRTRSSVRSPSAIRRSLRGRDLEIDLVGLELDEGIADVDGVPFLLQPLRDPRVDDRLADFGDDYIRWHLLQLPTSNAQLPPSDSQGLRLGVGGCELGFDLSPPPAPASASDLASRGQVSWTARTRLR